MGDTRPYELTEEELKRSMQHSLLGGRSEKPLITQIINSLTLAGIVALVAVTLQLRDAVTRIDTLITETVKQDDREFSRINGVLNDYGGRIGDMERERYPPNSPRPHH